MTLTPIHVQKLARKRRKPSPHQPAPRPAATTRGSPVTFAIAIPLVGRCVGRQALACRSRSSSGTTASVSSCVAASTTGGATPAASASRQRPTHRHQRSPARRPGKAPLGVRRGQVVAREPREHEERVGHHRADRVHARVLGTGVAAAVAEEAGDAGRRCRRASGPPSTFKAPSREAAMTIRLGATRAAPAARSRKAASLARCALRRRRARATRASGGVSCRAGTSAGAPCRRPVRIRNRRAGARSALT